MECNQVSVYRITQNVHDIIIWQVICYSANNNTDSLILRGYDQNLDEVIIRYLVTSARLRSTKHNG